MHSMADICVLDTHALIWYLEGNPKLGDRAKAVMDDSGSVMVLPMIALAEALFIVERGKTSIPDVQTLLNRVDSDPRITIYPLNREVLDKTLDLQVIPEMHDRQIVATTLILASKGKSAELLTKDTVLVSSKSVTTIW